MITLAGASDIFFSNSDSEFGVIRLMNKSAFSSGISRRRFLAATGVALAAPTIIPASALGREGNTPPSERVRLGVVGWGMQGPGNTGEFLNIKECQVVAACDIDKNHLQSALNTINGHYGNKDCQSFHDYREMMARPDIDAVMLAVPEMNNRRPESEEISIARLKELP